MNRPAAIKLAARITRPLRVVSPMVPQTAGMRRRLAGLARDFARETPMVLPLSMPELRAHAQALLDRNGIAVTYLDFAMVLISNAASAETFAAVPYERRLLLLPKCLRAPQHCPATFDALGLLCRECGLCPIQDVQREAEGLGYAVLVAEGSTLVKALLDTGRIDAIFGISCLPMLEKAFGHMQAAAIPGMAVPLLQTDCVDTSFDLDWAWEILHARVNDREPVRRVNLDALRDEVDGWFTEAGLREVMGPAPTEAERIARDCLLQAGKRWRPMLLAAICRALCEGGALPRATRWLAVAVECFHKASLVHDDIEDGDALRYGQQTVHTRHGIPIALNVGDLLLGEGYRLISESGVEPGTCARMMRIAALGHRALCLGQGRELSWTAHPRPLSTRQVLEIFSGKTSPAFDVAMGLGACCAAADEPLMKILRAVSTALGVAYQARDDLDDLAGEADDVSSLRPSLPMAIAWERSCGEERRLLERAWRREPIDPSAIRAVYAELDVEGQTRRMLEAWQQESIGALAGIEQPALKGVLRRIIGRIFGVELESWCSEFESGYAAGGRTGVARAG